MHTRERLLITFQDGLQVYSDHLTRDNWATSHAHFLARRQRENQTNRSIRALEVLSLDDRGNTTATLTRIDL